MTDLRPRLPRDRDGIAIDALAIGDTYSVRFGPTYPTHQIGPFDSDVVVRIATDFLSGARVFTSAAALTAYNERDEDAYGVFTGLFYIGPNQTERINLPKGSALHVQNHLGLFVSVTIMK
ncbi:MAG: hypothetical protein J0I31_11625 [Rhizobiales bacterium]|uniref:hypothetical protein n=1 Tax=Xanthobacter wiegelii TaxID=3119913 RepID=UPI001AC02C19|nr:hypothetical protein [Hyphomicrobiales bacterium]